MSVKNRRRGILPLNQYTEVYWTVLFEAIMNFIELRYEKTSQWEIQEYFKVLLDIVTELFTETTKNGCEHRSDRCKRVYKTQLVKYQRL